MNILRQFVNSQGIELLIDLETGEVFASQRGLARICQSPESTIRRFVSAHKLIVNTAQIQTVSGVQSAQLISEQGIKKTIIKYHPELLESLLDCGLRIYLHGLAGYTYGVKSTPAPQYIAKSHILRRCEEINKQKLPPGHWCIFAEVVGLIADIANQYPVSAYDLVDGSVGLCWSNHRKKLGLPKANTYLHHYPSGDTRGIREANCYLFDELPEFRKWFEEVYRVEKLPPYLKKKYSELTKVN